MLRSCANAWWRARNDDESGDGFKSSSLTFGLSEESLRLRILEGKVLRSKEASRGREASSDGGKTTDTRGVPSVWRHGFFRNAHVLRRGQLGKQLGSAARGPKRETKKGR